MEEACAWNTAFLGDDGGGVETRTVCGTADRYRDWLEGEHPSGCHTFQRELPVIIEVVTMGSIASPSLSSTGSRGVKRTNTVARGPFVVNDCAARNNRMKAEQMNVASEFPRWD